MANFFPLTIVTPRDLSFKGEVSKLIVRTTQGDVGILKGHTNYLAAISIGRLVVDTAEGRKFGAVNGGFVSMINGECVVSAISFEWADKIDLERAIKAKEAAEKMLAGQNGNDITMAKTRLLRSMNRIEVHKLSSKN